MTIINSVLFSAFNPSKAFLTSTGSTLAKNRIFLPDEFGVLSVLMSWVAFAMVVLSYGLETSFFHFAAKEKNQANVFSTGLLSLALSTSFFFGSNGP